jgi:carbonic anhydrase
MFKGDAGSLVINGTAYHLRQLHWHTPSEHTVGGRRYDMELHLVHESAANKAAVIGVLYKVGHPDRFLQTLEPAIRLIKETRDMEVPIGVVDPSGARATGSVYYRYMGSLTTPPCTEGVVWTVFQKVNRLLASCGGLLVVASSSFLVLYLCRLATWPSTSWSFSGMRWMT